MQLVPLALPVASDELGDQEYNVADDEQLMDNDEVAHYLKLNRRTVMRMAERGELPGIKVGKQWRYRRADIDAYLDKKLKREQRKQS